MKLLVPLNNKEHLKDYIKAGAEEFYIGFYDTAWIETFGEFADINRMSGFKKKANPYSLQEVIEIINQVKKLGKSIFVTFNSSMYSEEQMNFIRYYFTELKRTHLDGVIVSCLELVLLANEIGVPSIVSTIGGIYNSDLARFYQEKWVKRVILPRDLSIEEIKKIKYTVPDIEYEVFLMRNGCRYSDANCLGFHRFEKRSICSELTNVPSQLYLEYNTFDTHHEFELTDLVYSQNFHTFACGLCAIYDFIQLGVTAGKIVGRSDEWQWICEDILYARNNIEIAKRCNSRDEYLEAMQFPKAQPVMCKLGFSCYYPEIRF